MKQQIRDHGRLDMNRRTTTAPSKELSKMPIVTPRADLNPKIRVKTPDASVDYKLVIRTPAMESAK